jgi:uncharacterized protein
MTPELILLAVSFFAVAALYSTVGHAGASGYLAVMALTGVSAASMRPTALTLNVIVALITVYRFGKARHFSWNGLYPFLIGSVPFAAAGGAWQWQLEQSYFALVGVVLLSSALVLLWRAYGGGLRRDDGDVEVKPLPAIGIGAVIGLLSGLTGTGGGIFLSPVILFLGWAGPKRTAGISAPFILVNSAVALAAGAFSAQALPAELPLLAAAVMAGAVLGTWLGLTRLPYRALIAALALVMLLAAGKLLLTGY